MHRQGTIICNPLFTCVLTSPPSPHRLPLPSSTVIILLLGCLFILKSFIPSNHLIISFLFFFQQGTMASVQITRKRARRLTPEFAPGQTASSRFLVKAFAPYKFLIGTFPFLFFAGESLVAIVCLQLYGNSDPLLKVMFAQLLAVNATFTGLLHFYPPLYQFYTSMIFVPFQNFWLYFSGITFTISGLMIAYSETQVYGAWLLIFILILVFPGNIACVVHPYPRNQVCAGSMVGAILRLPFQFTFLIWAWWLTSGPATFPSF